MLSRDRRQREHERTHHGAADDYAERGDDHATDAHGGLVG